MKSYDPILREAQKEIRAILREHDIGGAFILTSKTHAEFDLPVDLPKWSVIRFLRGATKMHLKLYMKSRPDDTNSTAGMLCAIRDLCAHIFGQCNTMIEAIEREAKIERKPFQLSDIKNEDREETSKSEISVAPNVTPIYQGDEPQPKG